MEKNLEEEIKALQAKKREIEENIKELLKTPHRWFFVFAPKWGNGITNYTAFTTFFIREDCLDTISNYEILETYSSKEMMIKHITSNNGRI